MKRRGKTAGIIAAGLGLGAVAFTSTDGGAAPGNGSVTGRSALERRLSPAVVLDAAHRSHPSDLSREGISGEEYLFAVRSAGSCVQDLLSRDPRITGVQVVIPEELSADRYLAEYRVSFQTTEHGKGRVLRPADFSVVESADAECRERHIGSVEDQYQAKLRAEEGARAVEKVIECLGADRVPRGNYELARNSIEHRVKRSEANLDCLARAPLAAAVLAGDR